jgi:hypothetical protein
VKIALRLVSILAALSVGFTAWFIVGFGVGGGLVPLMSAGVIGFLTIVGWLITLTIGPVAARRLWNHRETGRQAALILFGYGLLYYLVGLFALRTPGSTARQIVTMVAMYVLPLALLLSRRARQTCGE